MLRNFTWTEKYEEAMLDEYSRSGRSEEDGGGMYRVGSEELFLVSSEVF